MQEHRRMICISCPVGCRLDVLVEDGKAVSVSGNACKRGETYGRDEVQNPVRVLTTTMRVSGSSRLVPVRTDRPIPKGLMFEAMRQINLSRAPQKVRMGEVLIENICGCGANVIASRDFTVEGVS